MSEVLTFTRKHRVQELMDTYREAIYAMLRENPEQVLREMCELRDFVENLQIARRMPPPQIDMCEGVHLSHCRNINIPIQDYDRFMRVDKLLRGQQP